jgi:hypothetical protein
MRCAILFPALFLTLALALCPAGTITDPFHQPQNNCNYGTAAPYSACDVMGTPANYDIEKIDITYNAALQTATATIYMDSAAVISDGHGSYRLSGFSDAGESLIPGDLFFYKGSDAINANWVNDYSDIKTAQYLKYGVPLVNHGGFTAGALYGIDGADTLVESAAAALNGGGSSLFRRSLPVEMIRSAGSTGPVSVGSGTIAVAPGAGGTHANWVVTASFNAPDSFIKLLDGGYGILFSSANCGNDYIQGYIQAPVPEPQSLIMVAAGAGLLALARFARRKA